MNIKNMLDLISAVFITSTFTAGLGEASSDFIAGHFSAQIWSHASWWAQTRREHTRAEDKGRIQNRNPRGTNTKSFHLKSKKHLRSTMFSYYLFLRILVCSSERSSDVCLRSRGDETVKQTETSSDASSRAVEHTQLQTKRRRCQTLLEFWYLQPADSWWCVRSLDTRTHGNEHSSPVWDKLKEREKTHLMN